jgi:hypothetical protein
MKVIELHEWLILIKKAIEYGITKEEVRNFIEEYSKIKSAKEKIQAKQGE